MRHSQLSLHVIGLGVDLISACDIRYAAYNSVKVGELNVNHFVELVDDSEQVFKALKPGLFYTYNNIDWD